MNFNFEISRVDCRYDIYIKQDKMERDCCEFICGGPMTFQGYGIEQNIIQNRIIYTYGIVCMLSFFWQCYDLPKL